MGEETGLASIKFSGSPSAHGKMKIIKMKIIKIVILFLSFKKNFSVNLIFLELVKIFLLDPVSCKRRICKITKTNRMKGIKKWRLKKNEIVCLLTENPPHIHNTKFILNTENKFVITEAPHKDICPQGRT